MTAEQGTIFLTNYLQSLKERTRSEKKGDQFGIDWVVYNLGIAQGLLLTKAPFFRSGKEFPKTKTEIEFGIDLAFLSKDHTELTIFVLKDEPLKNKTWHKSNFYEDLANASKPSLAYSQFRKVKSVKIILVYNQDDDDAGIRLYENFVEHAPKKLNKGITLSFERWNLSLLTKKVQTHVFSPDLLPQKFYSLFSYICAQFEHISYGSDAWKSQVIPTWNRFLSDLLGEKPNKLRFTLIPVTLLILKNHGRENPSFELGWIDLVEWATLHAWQAIQRTPDKDLSKPVVHMWIELYLAELARYFNAHWEEISAKHFFDARFDSRFARNPLQSVFAAFPAFWHLGRMGLLSLALQEVIPTKTQEQIEKRWEALNEITNRIAIFLNNCPAANRPILDIHHIELFLVWRSFFSMGRLSDIERWLGGLEKNLFVRRIARSSLPFIEGKNNLSLVLEFISKEKPYDFCDSSSFLILMLMEFCLSIPNPQGEVLLQTLYREIVLAVDEGGNTLNESSPINLIAWFPPEDWAKDLFSKSLATRGEGSTLNFPAIDPFPSGKILVEQLHQFIKEARKSRALPEATGFPISAAILACIKHESPLPMEFWRGLIIPYEATGKSNVKKKSLKTRALR